ncbi:MAG TPA: hypothetical protein VMZ91_05495 [Candidatus Paceibacterota bacterium]|nr:hypothetical protein [Candidatus Paceibacterota bacterium]
MNDVNRERILIGGSVLLGSGIGIISPLENTFSAITFIITGIILQYIGLKDHKTKND